MKDIFQRFHISENEFKQLHVKYSRLCYKAAHQLKKKNTRNNYTDDIEDISQELFIAMIRAGSYHKRQIYIGRCLEATIQHASDPFLVTILKELQVLWDNRKRHGANRQKFGRHQEVLLERIVRQIVPRDRRPRRSADLVIDTEFDNYCKAIIWNNQKSMGKKITREKSIRGGLVSLSEFDFLG